MFTSASCSSPSPGGNFSDKSVVRASRNITVWALSDFHPVMVLLIVLMSGKQKYGNNNSREGTEKCTTSDLYIIVGMHN